MPESCLLSVAAANLWTDETGVRLANASVYQTQHI